MASHAFGSEAVTEEGLSHGRAAQAPLEEQGFLGLRPGCFRTLGFWRAVRLGAELLCVAECHPRSPPWAAWWEQCPAALQWNAVLGLEEEQGLNLCQSSGACKDD